MERDMRLLLSNDDGIDSPLFHILVHALQAAGHDLFIVAPLHEQSWTGAAKSRHRPVASALARRDFGCPAWTVDGTPADCVNIALAHLLPRHPAPTHDEPAATRPDVDAVVSGINLGRNTSLGFILASGTIAAAWEGALHGLPAIAFSQELNQPLFVRLKNGEPIDAELGATLQASAAHAVRLVNELLPPQLATPAPFTVHNVNFPLPCRADTPVHRTVPAQVRVPGLFSPAADDGTHRFIYSDAADLSPPGLVTDKATLAAGNISHSILDYTRLGAPVSGGRVS
ncbi:5'/3'-nucleotidase SurE [Geminisphaera colitermitum]|uniref:5'/3'-nucleotidase SurE n=1 Tax=Geminisphaera colitermitum TaxID=1148786 RepID=UPI000158E2AE|nr:5'/3'-nucleotidase SurE [Geminisphaera colitermitum]